MEGYEGLNKSRELRLKGDDGCSWNCASWIMLDHPRRFFFPGSMLRRHCEILLCGKDAIFIVFATKTDEVSIVLLCLPGT
jgi:hypothetical protein